MITAIVSVETLLLVVLIVLVAGLLRSNAALLRRVGEAGALPSPPPGRASAAAGAQRAAPALSGVTPSGDAISLSFSVDDEALTLLSFLTSGCGTCARFWDELAAPGVLPGEIRPLIVTHDRDRERISRVRGSQVPVVMSDAAWEDYEVPGSPYFVLVDGSIRGEGVATTTQALSSLIADALEHDRPAGTRTAEEAFASAGLPDDDPSLYPAGRERQPVRRRP